MAIGCTTVNLGFVDAKPEKKTVLLDYLVKLEAWLDRRTSSRALYTFNDRDLADIGLTRADVEGLNGHPGRDY